MISLYLFIIQLRILVWLIHKILLFLWFLLRSERFISLALLLRFWMDWNSRDVMLVLRLISGCVVRASTLLRAWFWFLAFGTDVCSASGLVVAGFVVVFELGVWDCKGVVFDAFLLFAYGKSGWDAVLAWYYMIILVWLSTLNSLASITMNFHSF